MAERLVTVRTYSRVWEADLARAALEQEGICAVLRDEEIVRMVWHYGLAFGGVRLCVPEGEAEEATRLLGKLEGGAALEEQAQAERAVCPKCGSAQTEPVEPGLWGFVLGRLLPRFGPRLGCRDCGEVWRPQQR